MRQALLDWRPWLLLYALQIPSLRALVKYLPESLHIFIPIYFIVAFFAYIQILNSEKYARLFRSRAVFIGLIVLHIALNATIYPRADALKLEGRGSPQDDALIVGGERLIAGVNPYEGETFLNEWVSAGPAWVAIALPFTLTKFFALFTPFWVALTAFVISRIRSLELATLFLILCFSSPLVWELSVTGSDMLAMGCAFLLLILWSYRAWTGGGAIAKFFSALFSASVTTSRIVFGYLLALVAGFLLRKKIKTGFAYGIAAIGLFILIQLPFYLWNPERYFPLTRFYWAKGLLGPTLEITATVSSAIVLIYLALKTKLDEHAWIKCALLSLVVTMFWSALGDLKARDYSLSAWEGANYFGPLIPTAVLLVIDRFTPRFAEAT
ncbi:MAG: hypothetical protein KDB65_06670 [Calditrichaeota bacterium]|nr:hypothetical protein [Calditrichota bacterium]MCB9369724.1 hypothetical protein [Calditrichota bacterium]